MSLYISFQVDRCLSALQTEVENFVLRMAAEFPNRKEQLIFLINNYDMMLAVLSVSHWMNLHTAHSVLQLLPLVCTGACLRRVEGVREFQKPPACKDTGVC